MHSLARVVLQSHGLRFCVRSRHCGSDRIISEIAEQIRARKANGGLTADAAMNVDNTMRRIRREQRKDVGDPLGDPPGDPSAEFRI